MAPFTQPALPLPPSEPPPTASCTGNDPGPQNASDEDSMDDLPMLVEDVSSDEESMDDIMSLYSSVESYDD